MARSSAAAAVLLLSFAVAAFYPAAAQRAAGSGVSAMVAAAAPGSGLAANVTGIAGEASANRTVGTQLVVPPGGCLVVSVTAGQGMCLQDAAFRVNNVSIATPTQYRQAGIAGSNSFFNLSNYRANNGACASQTPGVTQVYERKGCVLSDAAQATTGIAATNIDNSFVCSSSGTDTTNFARAFGATREERMLCAQATQLAVKAAKSPDAAATSGDPCTAPRALYIIENPCMGQNVTLNTTAKFFLADATNLAPAPAPEVALAPATAPGAAGPSGSTLAPETAPAAGPAAAANAPGPASTESAKAPAPAPGSQGARRNVAFGVAGAFVGAVAAMLVVA